VARIEEVTVSLIDDFDGTEASETVKFALDGKNYEIDLSKSNATELRRTLRPYIDRSRAARRVSASRRTTKTAAGRGPSRRSEGYDRTEVRAWAKANRIKVAPRGRISNEIVERWRKASK
jgi:nucleoid-associated protein Lsr2